MSYQVLARKWRPGNFDELVGQAHVLRALSSALDNERLHHAYLFTGTRGVGKTTIARILARCLNCDQGISSKPCGSCSSCTEINEGRFVDLIEVDAASRTKVEDTRELLENVQYRPTRGRYKVYLIDEVHMLSNHSFNALLKTLEEPPPHVVFLLATTDPQKLPTTVLSRCLQFHLKNMLPDDISNHLDFILKEESIENEMSALESIAWSAKGSMRDALSLLDQAIAFGDGKVMDKDVREMLGTIDRDHVYRLVSALTNNDGAACMNIIEELSQFAPDYDDVLAELLAVLHRIALLQQIPEASLATQDQIKIEQLANEISAEDVQLFYQLALHGRRDLPMAPDKRSGFEMCILRLMSFRPASKQDVTGVTPVKKSEGSSQIASVEVEDASTKLTEQLSDPATALPTVHPTVHPTTETADASYADSSYSESAYSESSYDDYDPRDEAINQSIEAASAEESTTSFIDRPLKSPLLRNKPSSLQSADSVSIDSESKNSITSKITTSIVPIFEEAVPEVPETIIPEANMPAELTSEPLVIAPIVDKEVEQQQAVKVAFYIDDDENSLDLPPIENLTQNNWYCVIAKSSLTGVTEQIALNSQFLNFDGETLELSLSNNIRSMVSNEHINKLTAALNGLYNGSYKITISDLEPEYETPRSRKQRIQQQRHQAACDNLYKDHQLQGLLTRFEAKLDHDTVETFLH